MVGTSNPKEAPSHTVPVFIGSKSRRIITDMSTILNLHLNSINID